MSKFLIIIQLINDFHKRYGFIKSLTLTLVLVLLLIFALFIIANIFLPFTYIAV